MADSTNQHKISAAKTLAELVDGLTTVQIILNIFDQRLVSAVAAKIV